MKPEIKVNDLYIKLDAPNIVWVVDQLLSVSDPVPHVRLVQAESSRQITLSVPALQDASIYKKL